MRATIILALIASLLWSPSVAISQTREPPKTDRMADDIKDLKRDTSALKDSLEAVRRDQLNYKIEKDLLKDAFSSNLQTVNLVITIVLGVFAILGYLGFKGMLSIKSEYATELENLRKLKGSLEQEIKTVVDAQNEVRDELGKMEQVNADQEKRLKVLEIKEKVIQLMEAKKYGMALEFANAGLEIDPKNTPLLNSKALCHYKFAQFEQGLEVYKKVLEIEPTNVSAIENMAEGLIIVEKIDEFDQLCATHKEILEKSKNGVMPVYLSVLRGLATNNIDAVKAALRPFVQNCPDGAAPRLGTWSFLEIRWYIRKLPSSPMKEFISKVIDFFEGKLATQEIKPRLQA